MSWQAGPVVPGVARFPRRRLEPRAIAGLLKAIERWTAEASEAGRAVRRVALTYGAGREGFWIARYLLVRAMFCRPFRDRRAVASFGGLTGTPFRSGGMEREQGIDKHGNARVRRIVM